MAIRLLRSPRMRVPSRSMKDAGCCPASSSSSFVRAPACADAREVQPADLRFPGAQRAERYVQRRQRRQRRLGRPCANRGSA